MDGVLWLILVIFDVVSTNQSGVTLTPLGIFVLWAKKYKMATQICVTGHKQYVTYLLLVSIHVYVFRVQKPIYMYTI